MAFKREDVERLLVKAGVDNKLVQQVGLELDKEEHPSVRLDKALPFPIFDEKSESAICEFCGRTRDDHTPLDYFVTDQHILEVLRFLDLLERSLSVAEALELKMEYQSTDSITSPKEMVGDDKEFLLNGQIGVLNVFDELRTYHTPYETLKEKIRVALESLDSFVLFYKTRSSFYVDELQFYKKRYDILYPSEVKVEPRNEADPKPRTKNEVCMDELTQDYEERARKEYEYLRSHLAKLNQRIMRLKESSEGFEKKERFEDIRQIVDTRDKLALTRPTVRTVRTRRVR